MVFGYDPREIAAAGVEFGNQVRGIRDRRNIAEMAAARLESVGGDQGKYWANQLRQDPRAALTMAQQYGGLGAIEQSLVAAQSAGQAQAQIRQLDGPGLLRYWQERDPTKAEALRKSMGLADANAERRIIKGADGFNYYADTGQRVLPGVQKQKDRRDIITDRQGRSRYADTGEFVFPDDANYEATRFDPERIDRLRVGRRPVLAEIRNQQEAIDQWESTDFENPANDAKLVKMFVQQVEPGLQVTSAEGDAVAVAAESGAGALTQRISRMLTPSGQFSDAARKLMIASIDDSIHARSRSLVDQYAGMEAENQDFFGDDEAAKRESLAGSRNSIERLRSFIEPQAQPEHYSAAVESLRANGIPDDQITPELVADMIEGMGEDDAAAYAPVSPPQGYAQAGGNRAPTMDEIRRIAERRR